MASFFQDHALPTPGRSMSTLERDPQGFRRRAAQCRELADTCLTSDAQRVLADLAADLDREAFKLEEVRPRSVIGGGRG